MLDTIFSREIIKGELRLIILIYCPSAVTHISCIQHTTSLCFRSLHKRIIILYNFIFQIHKHYKGYLYSPVSSYQNINDRSSGKAIVLSISICSFLQRTGNYKRKRDELKVRSGPIDVTYDSPHEQLLWPQPALSTTVLTF